MITSISVAKEDIGDMEYLKDWCKTNGVSKSFIIMKLVCEWVKKQEAKDGKE